LSAAEALRAGRTAGIQFRVAGETLNLEAAAPPPVGVLDLLSECKTEIIDLLREERRGVVMWVNDHFQSSPPGICGHCFAGTREDDSFVVVFVGECRGDFHPECFGVWLEQQEEKARIALEV
jgi:hypothetical protein